MKRWSTKLVVTLGCSLFVGIGLGYSQQVGAEGTQTDIQKNMISENYESDFS